MCIYCNYIQAHVHVKLSTGLFANITVAHAWTHRCIDMDYTDMQIHKDSTITMKKMVSSIHVTEFEKSHL